MIRWIVSETALQQLLSGAPVYLLLVITGVCIITLSKGADWMVDGIVCLARRTGVPKIVISATIVSLGTTAPEAFVSVMAAFLGNPGLALGNGVGSIIADTGLIFGLTCMITRIPINRFILNRMGWVQVGSATLLVVVASAIALTATGTPMFPRWAGVLFLMLLGGYMYLVYRWSLQGGGQLEKNSQEADDASEKFQASVLMPTLKMFGGLTVVIVSARFLVPAAAEIAVRIGVPEDVIAATMVAFGTSLPELTTAIAAIRRKHPEIVVGNVVGADVLNCLFVIGAAATARPLAIPDSFFYFHFPAMLLILYSLRVFIAVNRRNRFASWQGAWLFIIYLIYVVAQYSTTINCGNA
ncbi:MAG: sodium:calcium antiporter [Desulfobacteraceae bacterium]|nr:sodium:calcium antiporter [Desulfobacteraceae bacterium]